MTQLHLHDSPDRERTLTEVAAVLGDLLVDLDVDWRVVGCALPELDDSPPSALTATDYRLLPLVDRLRTWICRHDVARLDRRARALVAELGDWTERSDTEALWHRRILAVVARGEYPSGRAIHDPSGRAIRGTSRYSNTALGPYERRCRAEVLTDLGWVDVRRGDATARWVAPEGTIWWHAASSALQRARRRAVAARGAQ